MAGRIRDADVTLVRERSPIAEVIGEYLQLRKSGGDSLLGLCPFHEEKSPSFHVTPSRGYYYCFGCSEGGDVITFVQKMEQLSFTEAVERLARRAGVELRYEQGGYVPGREQGQRSRLIEAHRAAAEFYAEQITSPAAVAGRRFLAERGFTQSDAERFGVGYAPAGWDALVKHLRQRGFVDAELVRGGLAKQGQRGLMDRFRDRLVWPIRDLSGEVIGFGARRLNQDDAGPKYLNSPETPIFKKGSVLYGLDLAKREITKRQQAVVVEGYTDVMACHLAGVSTAIATCGTAFGDEHIKILRRLLMDDSQFRGEVIFTFDGDAAGRRAALRAFMGEQKFVTQTFVAVQPDGLDPCDLRTKHGEAAVRDLVAARVPLFEFAIRSVLDGFDLDSTEGRLAALDAAAPLVASIKDRALRHLYAVNLDRWLGFMDEDFVLRRVAAHDTPGRGKERSVAAPTAARSHDSAEIMLEREALKLAVQHPSLLGSAFDELSAAFTVPAHAAVWEAIRQARGASGASTGHDWVERLRRSAPDEQTSGLVTRLAVEPLHCDGEPDGRYALSVVARVGELAVSRAINSVKSRLQRTDPAGDAAAYDRLFTELLALEQRRRLLREQAVGPM